MKIGQERLSLSALYSIYRFCIPFLVLDLSPLSV